MICALPSERGEKRGRLAGFALGAGAIAALVLFGGQAFGQQAIAPPNVTASAVFVLNADTGQSLYQKNENKAFRILSITKLITAYVLVQRLGGQLSDTVAITQAHLVPGSTAGLRKDDVWTLENLLYGMLLVSGNDAALAVADHVGRTILAEEKKRGSSIKRFVQERPGTSGDQERHRQRVTRTKLISLAGLKGTRRGDEQTWGPSNQRPHARRRGPRWFLKAPQT